MKTIANAFMLVLISAALISFTSITPRSPLQGADINRFLGQWTVDIQGGSVGWIEIRQENNFINGDVLWGGGSVLPVSNIFLASGNMLIIQRSNNVVRRRDENNNPLLTAVVTDWMEIVKDGDDRIKGILLRPRRNGIGVDTTSFTGVKLPPVPPAPDLSKLKFGKTVALFNGKDLTGWKLINPRQANGFKVADGTLVNDPVQTEGAPHISYGNLRTEDVYGDFNIKLEVNVPAGSNSGVYLRGMYEIQVSDSYQKELDPHNMGALYSRIKPSVNAE